MYLCVRYNIVYRLPGLAVANAFRLGAPVGAAQQIAVAVNPVRYNAQVCVELVCESACACVHVCERMSIRGRARVSVSVIVILHVSAV